MELMKKGFIWIGIVVIVLIGGYFVLSFNAVKFIAAKIERMERRGLIIAEIKVRPTHLRIKSIQYKDPHTGQKIFEIEEMKIYPGLFSPLTKTFKIRNCTLVNPIFYLYQSQEGAFVGPWAPLEKEEKEVEVFKGRGNKEKETAAFRVGRIRIQKGSIHFEDHKIGGNPVRIELKELHLDMKDIQYPIVSIHSPIELKGRMKGRAEETNIEIKGWIDPKTMDMEVFFKFREGDIKTFEPYYRKRVSAEIESGYMNMEAKVVLKNRVIDAPGELELVDLRVGGEGTVFWVPAKNLTSLLKTKGDRMKLSFHIKGNMDDPRFNLQEIILTRIAFSFLDALGIPIKMVGEEFLEGWGKDGEGWVEGLKSLKEMFKKSKEKKR